MKKRLLCVISACALALSLAACGEKDDPVQIVSDEESIHIEVGDEISVIAHTKKSETIRWSCEDGDVAAITADGRLTGVANGITVITAETDSGYDHIGLVVGNGVKGTEVVVRTDENGNFTAERKPSFNGNSKITQLRISLNGLTEDETLLLGTDSEAYLKVAVTPSDCDDTLYYTSSNPGVAEVDQTGTVVPKSRGTTIITVTAPNGVEDTFKIFVR
ncbi:MAG: Ig-like domain-containing protein [Oscillospiraceae bacterium]|nr:Ig-like domain-containing protein [Oscillospiraceae bacterium]